MASLRRDHGGQFKLLLCSSDSKSEEHLLNQNHLQAGRSSSRDGPMPGLTLLSARFKGITGSGWQKSGDNPPSFAVQDVIYKCQSPESTNGLYGPDQLTCPIPMGSELYLSSAQSLRLFLAVLGQC